MGTSMKAYVGVTNNDWFAFLSRQPDIDEVNFWQPSGKTLFRALSPREPFLFKLHAPHHYIAGGGFFAHSTILPVSLAWEAFGEKNGAPSLLGMRRLIEKIRGQASPHEDYNIGCILLEQPFFFNRKDWIPVPPDFARNIVRGKMYSLQEGQGRRLWDQVQLRLGSLETQPVEPFMISESQQQKRYGDPTVILPRLGQGSFRVMVTDVYQRRCAISQEKVLPALEAAHIKPFGAGGEHKIQNGILLRSDIHKLFDAGYVTVTGDHHFEVSRLIHDEFDNGKHYYTFHGKRINVPRESRFKPSREFLDWHNEHVFRG
jgi:putative restriction endonuclease